MSAPNALNLVLAALPSNSGKPAMPQAAEAAAGSAQQPFASVLQQKVNRTEAKPTEAQVQTGKSEAANMPTSPSTEVPNTADATTAASKAAEAALTTPAETLLPWLNGLPAQGAPTIQNTPALPLATDNAPSSDLLNLVAGQTIAGLMQAAQTQSNTPATSAKTNDTLSNKTQAPDALLSNLIGNGGSSKPQAQASLESHLPDQAASDSANLAAEALVQGSTSDKHGPATEQNVSSFANVLANMAATEKPGVSTRPQAVVNTPVGSEAWPKEMGERLVWMSNRQESRAELILTPQHMGKIEVSLNISGDQASVSFVSANPQVREALEAAMNRLREVLAESGINLGQTNVGAESSSTWAQQQKSGDNAHNMGADDAAAGSLPETLRSGTVTWQARGNGMVDVFA